jgi:hypothetical protein
MSLIDKTYFNFEINIPDNGDYSELPNYITRFESEILKKMFGYELAKQVISYVASTTTDPIKSLVEGAEYEDQDGNLQKWDGLINDDKISLIAYYVYFWYRKCTVTNTTSSGEKRSVNENSIDAEYGNKIMVAWDRMSEQIKNMYAYMNTIPDLLSVCNPALEYGIFDGDKLIINIGSTNAFDL